MSKNKSKLSRRSFLSNVAVAGATGTLGAGSLLTACSGGGSNENKITPLRAVGDYYIPELGDKAIDGKPVRAALIGCGSRGTGAAFNFLEAGDGLSIVAIADFFKDKTERCRIALKEKRNNEVADDRCFSGIDAYKKVCELPDVDVVLVASPSIFHPEQVKYAIDHGKNVFCEKAACIDSAGYRTFMMAVRQAQTKGLCIVTGTQRHYQRSYVESYRRIQEGYIGRITSANVYWNGSKAKFAIRRPEWTDMEYMIRDFFSWKWLSGDHVIDTLVHNVDIFTWFSHLKPVRVIGMGSRLRRTTGDVYDNFSADIEYEGGVHVHGMQRQIDGCDNRNAEIIQGTKGSWNNLNRIYKILDLDGNEVWRYDEKAAKEQ